MPSKAGETRNLRSGDNFKMFKCRTETFKSSFVPATTNLWNSLENRDRNSNYAQKLLSAKRNVLYDFVTRATAVKHAQLRMNCSKLNAHLYDLHVADSPECACSFDTEDTNHYLLHCPLYMHERNIVFRELNSIGVYNIDVDILTKGSKEIDDKRNMEVFSLVHQYIEETDRL